MNRLSRSVIVLVAVLLAGGIGGYRLRHQREIERLTEYNRQAEEQRRILQEMVGRLSAERRVADIYVLEQSRADDGRVASTRIRFVESSDSGATTSDQTITVPGDVLYFDGLVIKFLDEYVERGDALRGRSIVLFQRVFSNLLPPVDGFALDCPGQIPDVYRTARRASQVEQELWDDFWNLARDPEGARKRGVRVAQGEAVYAPMRAGERWQLTLENDGGLNLLLAAGGNERTPPALSPLTEAAASPKR
jgi:hypothetical protein